MTQRPEGMIEGSEEKGEPKTLSNGKRLSPAEQWQLMIPRMGIFALLRNLRNFDQAGVPDETAGFVREKLEDPHVIARSRIFPFQFLTAHLNTSSMRWAASLEKAVTHSVSAIPELPGKSLILIDTSASMNGTMSAAGGERRLRPGEPVPARPSRVQAAALFGIATAIRNVGRVNVWGFADGQFRVSGIEPGGSVLRLTDTFRSQVGAVGHGTQIERAVRDTYSKEDRVLIFTDEQTSFQVRGSAWGGYRHGDISSAVPQDVPVYAFNLTGYATSAMPAAGQEKRHMLGGLTDDTFTMIPRLENGLKARWPWEHK